MEQSTKLQINHLSYSSLKEFRKSPEHFYYYKTQPSKDKEVYRHGNAFDCLLLTPDKFKDQFLTFDEEKRPDKTHGMTAKENKAWKEGVYGNAIKVKKQIISVAEQEKFEVIAEKVRKHPLAGGLIKATGNVFQKKLTWKLKGFDHVAYLDIWNDAFIADVKFMANADPEEFHRKIYYYAYYLQGSMYVVGDKGYPDFKDLKDYYIIAVDKEAPYGISVNRLPNEYLIAGINEYLGLLDQIKICDKNNDWSQSYEWKSEFNSGGIFDVDTPYNLRS